MLRGGAGVAAGQKQVSNGCVPARSVVFRSLSLGVLLLGCGSEELSADGEPAGPVRIQASTRVFAGAAAMLFDGPACTEEPGATGDRWCGFVARSAEGSRNLFVVNVSAVISGADVVCGAEDPKCLLLVESLGGDGRNPTWHGTSFRGDTLVYYDDRFVPYAWRPGMSGGRRLVDASAELDAAFCTPAPRGTAVACLGIPANQPDESLVQAELLAGKADGLDEPLLAALDPVIAANAADTVPRFGFGFPAIDGDYLAWLESVA